MPALLTRMCSPPSAAMSRMAASTSAGIETSNRLLMAVPPAAWTAATASPAAASLAV